MEKENLELTKRNENESYSFLLASKKSFEERKYDESLSQIVDCLRLSDKYYYEATLIKTKVLIKKDNLEGALKLLEEELSMPYIPTPFNKEFEELYEETRKLLNAKEKVYSPFDLLDEDELKEKFKLATDLNTLMMLTYQIDKRNVRNYLDEIKDKLISDVPNVLKTLLLEVLNKQGVNEEIKLIKNGLEISLIPTCLNPVIDEQIFNKIINYVNNLNKDNNVSIDQLVNLYLINYFADIYPFNIEESEIEYLSKALFIKASQSLNIKIDQEENKFLAYYLEKLDNITII